MNPFAGWIGRVFGPDGWARSRSAAAVLTGALLAASYPPLNRFYLAWFAVSPLLIALAFSRRRESFKLGFLAGAAFWLATLHWLLRLTATSGVPAVLIWMAWVTLSAYCALFFGAFGLTMGWLFEKLETEKSLQSTALAVLTPLVWVGFEYLRSMLFGGFPWNPLGVSQYTLIPVIQISQWLGVYGVSALVMLMNAALALTVLKHVRKHEHPGYRPHPEIFIAVASLALCFQMGTALEARYRTAPVTVTIAAVQPNIPQPDKWSDELVNGIYDAIRRLTHEAVAFSEIVKGRKPDLIVWPETALPDYVRRSSNCWDFVQDLLEHEGVPILVGAVDYVGRGDSAAIYNTSFLFGLSGRILQRYDKQHLVPFGEYVPFDSVFAPIRWLEPVGWRCTPGRQATVFRLPKPDVCFSVAICFEDAFPALARAAMNRKGGAKLLINQTNDAWFEDSAGAAQHMSECVFRCVENRVPAVRAANTGMTCFIDRTGRITHDNRAVAVAGNGPLKPFTEGYCVSEVDVPSPDTPLTWYTRHGDMTFALPCAAGAIACFFLALWGAGRKNTAAET